MLSENIKALRKQRGMSQEALAQQLNVVRQTVSKWEKGLSVPDAELLARMAEVLDVPVERLLGARLPEEQTTDGVAKQLAILNEQLASRTRRHKQILRGVLLALAALVLFQLALCVWSFVLLP